MSDGILPAQAMVRALPRTRDKEGKSAWERGGKESRPAERQKQAEVRESGSSSWLVTVQLWAYSECPSVQDFVCLSLAKGRAVSLVFWGG